MGADERVNRKLMCGRTEDSSVAFFWLQSVKRIGEAGTWRGGRVNGRSFS